MQVEKAHSDDYAILESGNLYFYYGYEEQDSKTEEWCFTVKKNGTEIFRITSSYIQENVNSKQIDDPKDYLIAGIGIWLLLK